MFYSPFNKPSDGKKRSCSATNQQESVLSSDVIVLTKIINCLLIGVRAAIRFVTSLSRRWQQRLVCQ